MHPVLLADMPPILITCICRGKEGAPAVEQVTGPAAPTMLTAARLLLIVLTRDQPSREGAAARVS